MKLLIKKGTTSKMQEIFIQDTSSSSGAGLTGLTDSSPNLTCYYYLNDAAVDVEVILAPMTLGTYVQGGFVEIDSVNMPGAYSLGLPDGALTGADSVLIYLRGANNMAPVPMEIQLVDFDPNDTVRMGMTALPNAVPQAAGGLITSIAGSLDLDATVGPLNYSISGVLDVNALRINSAVISGDGNATPFFVA